MTSFEAEKTGMEIARIAVDGVELRAKSCTAAIYGLSSASTRPLGEFVGTGTLLEHEGRLFILTCEHVATDFYGAAGGLVATGAGQSCPTVDRSDTALWRHSKRDDIALIEVDRSPPALRIQPRTTEDFHIEKDFRRLGVGRRGFALVGFPSDLVEAASQGRRRVHALTYGAVDYPLKKPTKNRLYLQYRYGDCDLPLPHPRGLSGAAVIAFDEAKPNELWRYGRIVALQFATAPRTQAYLVATTLRKLGDWLGM